MQDYWLPTPFTSFPFTSPPVRHRVPSHSDSAILRLRMSGAIPLVPLCDIIVWAGTALPLLPFYSSLQAGLQEYGCQLTMVE